MMQMEEEEAILEYGNYGSYYVQSPSSVSHAHSTTESESCRNSQLLLVPPYHHHSPLQEEEQNISYGSTKPLLNQIDDDNQLQDHHHALSSELGAARTSTFSNLSRCSSSRASTTSFVHQNKMMMTVPSAADHNAKIIVNGSGGKNDNNNIVVHASSALKRWGKVDDEEEYCYNYEDDKGHCWQYFSFSTYPSSVWIALQVLWRLLLSAMVALLVFYLITKPPPPHISVKVIKVNQFELTEGVDLTGVATNFLSCNISLTTIIDNRSKVFGIHILSPVVDIHFDRVSFIISQGPKLYVRSREWREMEVYTGTTKKAMYGGGRNMEDMLSSQTGLPLIITLNFNSYFRVVSNFIHSNFHHQAHCLLLLHNFYDIKHHTLTRPYNSTCHLLTS